MTRSYSNFTNPIGLVLRMLASGDRAAYGALMREALAIGATPLDCLLQLFERRFRRSTCDSQHPLLLIVGPPRSGTTLVSQVLAHHLDVTFPTNAGAILHRSPLTTAWLQRRLTSRSRPSFESFYGQTAGLCDCNDGFSIWNQWLGEDRYCPTSELSPDQAEDMRCFFNAWTAMAGKPFLNKNNRNAGAIQLLARHLPNARFVVVRRNPVATAQSLIVARRRIQGDASLGWGLNASSTTNDDAPLAHVDSVCEQVASINGRIDDQLACLASDRFIEVSYEAFCRFPAKVVLDTALAFHGITLDPNADLTQLKPFTVSNAQKVSAEEYERLIDWYGLSETESKVTATFA